MTMSHDDYYARAMQARIELPPAMVWTMLKSHLYLTAGFAGASVAAIALRALVLSEPTSLSPLALVAAVAGGVALTVFAWYRATRVLQPAAEATSAVPAPVTIDHVPSALGGFSQG